MDKNQNQQGQSGSQFHSQKTWDDLSASEQGKFTNREDYEAKIASGLYPDSESTEGQTSDQSEKSGSTPTR